MKLPYPILDQHLGLLGRVATDINPYNVEDTGRKGLSVESVLRCAILKQFRQLSYQDLVFCLMDSASMPDLCPFEHGMVSQKIGAARLYQCHH